MSLSIHVKDNLQQHPVSNSLLWILIDGSFQVNVIRPYPYILFYMAVVI